MTDPMPPNEVSRLFRYIGETLGQKGDLNCLLQEATNRIGEQLDLDRCAVLLLENGASASRQKSLSVAADFAAEGRSRLNNKVYHLSESSEFFALLRKGRPLPLKAMVATAPGSSAGHLEHFIADSQSKIVIAFPMVRQNRIIGCLSMHRCEHSEPFSEALVELGEAVAEVLAGAVVMVIDPPTSSSDAKEATDALRLLRAEEMTNTLSKQLSWERWVRQIICKLHASLDRDTLLQTVVDGFGRALGASRCLIVRTEGLVSPMVTHEYVEPDISPLGLGRTGQFPPAAISFFRQKVGAIADLSVLEKSGQLTVEEYEYFAENGVRGMAGAPISSHGINFGVIVILECGPVRKWAPHELDMLEIAASQTAVALSHSQSFLQLKDQLFNMNLLGNLTQQLTTTLELVNRGTKSDGAEEKAKLTSNAPPLSLRELEVLKLIASGLANREIAQRLFLTESTVELHASRIRKKLKLKSRTALVKYACDNGLA